MKIKVEYIETNENKAKVFADSFETGRKLAEKAWGAK